jgi:PIN domain nuclease of toxin-antitoxin system
MPTPEAVLLDTHVWLWMAGGERIAPPARRLIEAAAGADNLFMSPISIREVGMLAAKGRIAVQPDCLAWVTDALAKTGVRLLPLTVQVAVGSSFLPEGFHGDPADRIIVASAIAASATLITRDAQILAYARRGHFKVITA